MLSAQLVPTRRLSRPPESEHRYGYYVVQVLARGRGYMLGLRARISSPVRHRRHQPGAVSVRALSCCPKVGEKCPLRFDAALLSANFVSLTFSKLRQYMRALVG